MITKSCSYRFSHFQHFPVVFHIFFLMSKKSCMQYVSIFTFFSHFCLLTNSLRSNQSRAETRLLSSTVGDNFLSILESKFQLPIRLPPHQNSVFFAPCKNIAAIQGHCPEGASTPPTILPIVFEKERKIESNKDLKWIRKRKTIY